MVLAVWGFTSSGRAPVFNARAETVDSLPSDRQPFYFERADALPLAFAGIWRRVGDHLEATVITTTPSRDMAGVHDRMPVILSPDRWTNWLSATPLPSGQPQILLCPSPDGTLTRWPVGKAVGSVRNDYRELIDPVAPPAIAQELF